MGIARESAEHGLALGPAIGARKIVLGRLAWAAIRWADLTDLPTAKADERLLDNEKLIRMGVV
jgi:hypothetical protein